MEGIDGPEGILKIKDAAPASETPSATPKSPLPFKEGVARFTYTQGPSPPQNGRSKDSWAVEEF